MKKAKGQQEKLFLVDLGGPDVYTFELGQEEQMLARAEEISADSMWTEDEIQDNIRMFVGTELIYNLTISPQFTLVNGGKR